MRERTVTERNGSTGGGARAAGARFTAYADGADPYEAFARARGHARGYDGTTEENRITHKDRFTVIGGKPVLALVALDVADRVMQDKDPRITERGPAGAIAVTQNGDGVCTGWLFFGLISPGVILGERARAALLAHGSPDSATARQFRAPAFYLCAGVGVTVSVAWENPSEGDRAAKIRDYEEVLTRAGLTVVNRGESLYIPEDGNG
jgi:hypothetical protein